MVYFLRSVIIVLLSTALVTACALRQQGAYHVVEEGQTLYRISKTYGVDEKKIARINRINNPTRLQVGSRLFIPGARGELKVLASNKPSPPFSSLTPPPSAVEKHNKVIEKAPNTNPKDNLSGEVKRDLFSWPVKGAIVRRFGSTNGTLCQGIEIATPPLSSVLAAAAGKVIYSGSDIPGYGHLVIIGHEESFFTVYGFNDRNLVKTGSYVGQGDEIALSGTPTREGTPRIHFEIRHGKQPVDPLFYLP